jgi:hypothetical protein
MAKNTGRSKTAASTSKNAALGKQVAKAIAPVAARNLKPGQALDAHIIAGKAPKGSGKKC